MQYMKIQEKHKDMHVCLAQVGGGLGDDNSRLMFYSKYSQ